MLDTLISFVTVLLALSVASERLVELIKGFSSALTGQKSDAAVERRRQLTIHWLSLAASAVAVFLLQDYIVSTLKLKELGWLQGMAFTILSSGGSSMWNSILTYLLSLKTLKQQAVTAQQRVGNSDLSKGLPTAMPTL
jgi:hypothetical protein